MNTQTGELHVNIEVDTGMKYLQAKELTPRVVCQQQPEDRTEAWGRPFTSTFKRNHSADTFILDLEPPEL